jgi:hypothetical protein
MLYNYDFDFQALEIKKYLRQPKLNINRQDFFDFSKELLSFKIIKNQPLILSKRSYKNLYLYQ